MSLMYHRLDLKKWEVTPDELEERTSEVLYRTFS